MKTPTKKEIEYEDAPSGFVTMYNYKEPFMKFENGYGFQGVLLFDGLEDKVQCHFCGKWFESLGNHLAKEHNMLASEYKTMTGLAQTTALISEKLREKLVANGMERRLKNLKSRKGKKVKQETRDKIRKTLQERTREYQNLRGTCPAQLIARLQNEYQRLGYTPRRPKYSKGSKSFMKYPPEIQKEIMESQKRLGAEETYTAVFGSWEKALEMANIPRRLPSTNIKTRLKWTEDKIIEFISSFIESHDRLPKISELPNGIYLRIKADKLNKGKLYADASVRSHKRFTGLRYSKEQLLDFLRNFEKVHSRKPSYSDCKRGLLPHLSRFSYNFGSWQKALALAFNK